MIELKELISERLKLSKDSQTSKVSQDVYFNEDNIDEYIKAINNNIFSLGYMATFKNNETIWIFKKNLPVRSQSLKNLICVIRAKNYIDWGPNEKLKDKLEEPIKKAIDSIN